MLHFLLWFTIAIGCALTIWALEGNGASALMQNSPVYVNFILFIVCGWTVVYRGYLIWKHFSR